MAVNMVDPDKRDRAVAFIEAEARRLDLVRTLEKRSEALTLDFIKSSFPYFHEAEVLKTISDLESQDIIWKMSDDPPTWDLSEFGREILYALEPIPRTHKFSPARIIGRLINRD